MPFRNLLGAVAVNMIQRRMNEQQAYNNPAFTPGFAPYGGPVYAQQPAQQNGQPAGYQTNGAYGPTVPPAGPTPNPNINPGYYGGPPPPYAAGPHQPIPPNVPTNDVFNWGSLINPDKTPSLLFTRLIDAIFNFADRSFPPQNTSGLEPAKSALLYDAMGFPLAGNPSKQYLQLAVEARHPMPEATRNEALSMFYRVFGFQFFTPQGAMPVLSREGFRASILIDSLVDPGGQLGRLNRILARHHAQIIDPETNVPFLSPQIPRDAFPAVGDAETQALQRNRNVEFNAQLNAYLRDIAQMQMWVHGNTMAAMGPVVWGYTGNGYGYGYGTGGFTW